MTNFGKSVEIIIGDDVKKLEAEMDSLKQRVSALEQKHGTSTQTANTTDVLDSEGHPVKFNADYILFDADKEVFLSSESNEDGVKQTKNKDESAVVQFKGGSGTVRIDSKPKISEKNTGKYLVFNGKECLAWEPYGPMALGFGFMECHKRAYALDRIGWNNKDQLTTHPIFANFARWQVQNSPTK